MVYTVCFLPYVLHVFHTAVCMLVLYSTPVMFLVQYRMVQHRSGEPVTGRTVAHHVVLSPFVSSVAKSNTRKNYMATFDHGSGRNERLARPRID